MFYRTKQGAAICLMELAQSHFLTEVNIIYQYLGYP